MIDTNNLEINFGKHKGERWTRLPISYLKWLINVGSHVKDIAEAELNRRGTVLDRDLELSAHAIDRASLKLRKNWYTTRKDEEEGIYTWLYRTATEALTRIDTDTILLGRIEIVYMGIKFVFEFGEVYPTLVTVMPQK